MLEFLGSGIFGAIFGGIFRLVPEVLKFFDKKNERDHELSMFDRQCDLEKVRGQIKLDGIAAQSKADIDNGVIEAFRAAITQQEEMATVAGGWAAKWSAMMRPAIAFYMFGIYGIVKIAFFWYAISTDQQWIMAFQKMWTSDDASLLAGISNYLWLDRTLNRRGL